MSNSVVVRRYELPPHDDMVAFNGYRGNSLERREAY